MHPVLKRIPKCSASLLGALMKYTTKAVEEPAFLGAATTFTDVFKFVNKDSYSAIPTYRIMRSNFKPNNLDKQTLRQMYRNMVSLSVMDDHFIKLAHEGRILLYLANTGEEAIHVGSCTALSPDDLIYAQYREAGVLLTRGFTFSQCLNQVYSNCDDVNKGKQMEIHYGSKPLNFVTISSPLTTQLPQAVGAAYAFKREKRNTCVVCYFGEGAASEGDAHAAFNFAATLECPVVFICRNNGYAISTPSRQQYKGDGIAARGPAYGINTIRVDGNDVLAMHQATLLAREFAIKNSKPVLIEAMSYRIGDHGANEDSTLYRSANEIIQWSEFSPIIKFRRYLEELGYWTENEEKSLLESLNADMENAISEAENKPKLHWKELFNDVYASIPEHIRKQMSSMEDHVNKYSQHYPLDKFTATRD